MTSTPKELELEEGIIKTPLDKLYSKEKSLKKEIETELKKQQFQTETIQKIEPISDEQTILLGDPLSTAIMSIHLSGRINVVSNSQVNDFINQYREVGYKLKPILQTKIIPIQKKGFRWEAPQSKRLREKFKSKIDDMLSFLGSISAKSQLKIFAIDANDVSSQSEFSDQFSDVAGFSTKKAKKRKTEKSGLSVLYSSLFEGKSQVNIACMISAKEEKHKNEAAASSFLLNEFTEMMQNSTSALKNSPENLLREFILKNNFKIMEQYNQKASVFAGALDNDTLSYVLMGEISIYGFDGKNFVLIEDENDFYLGSTVQRVHGRAGNKVIDMLYPDMIRINKTGAKGYIGFLVLSANAKKALDGKRKIKFENAKELIDKLAKKSKKCVSTADAGALFFYV